MLNICILGGSGFIGRKLCARLVAEGHAVTVLTRHRARHREVLVLPGVRAIEGDVYNRTFLQSVFEGQGLPGPAERLNAVTRIAATAPRADVVINLVGILNERGHRGRGFQRAHTELPALIVEACHAAGVPRLLHMSALNAARGAPSHYLRTKAMGEEIVHRANAPELRVTSFRPSVIFGAGDSFTNRFAGLLRLTPGVFPLACAHARFQPVFVGDVVHAFVAALAHTATFGQTYNLCGPTIYSLGELVEYIGREIGRRVRVIPLPDVLARLQAGVLEFVPGKPFSIDNYHSLQIDSVCRGDNLRMWRTVFGIAPESLESVAPRYLRPAASG